LPPADMGGFFIGGSVGALFGVAGTGAAVGVGIGLGMGVALTENYAEKFCASDH
jgi:hypothetical protein